MEKWCGKVVLITIDTTVRLAILTDIGFYDSSRAWTTYFGGLERSFQLYLRGFPVESGVRFFFCLLALVLAIGEKADSELYILQSIVRNVIKVEAK
ncbi:MAG: hypothetical protein A2940_01975 [Candidatus Wildermuthbacteria bacterium RIFCSPLOWO2_01_FULL_48_29]|uniref:Uncharacterized protein n=2 Tax=Candidatus Wildermuthiibacteriota TaxID=1817923 RepID=A0A1G2RMW8_9BACT|nr:MAG: hypothetical protein A2843_00275 [Candidatus Wildermuthbacteria bacterium RIFCSPHIGHO2_01_FULL_48_27b]OHA74193.1 MAG: hypothetical protein A2940_01975 [Candidatus Wildermuthbacteria bacterium RIFCSPLOWO2_01_FULL_48_29]